MVLDGGRICMQNKSTGRETRIGYDNGQCMIYVWVPAATENILKGNRFAIFVADREGQVFCWQEGRK